MENPALATSSNNGPPSDEEAGWSFGAPPARSNASSASATIFTKEMDGYWRRNEYPVPTTPSDVLVSIKLQNQKGHTIFFASHPTTMKSGVWKVSKDVYHYAYVQMLE
jgi:hypothetical protein